MINKINSVRKYINFIGEYKQYIIPIFVIGFFSSIFRIALPFLSKYLIDASFLKKDTGAFIRVSVLSAVFFIISLFFKAIEGIVKNKMQTKVKYKISKSFLHKVFALDFFYFQRFSTGENIFRLTDTERVTFFLVEQVPHALIDATLFICMLVLSFFISPLLALPLFFLLPLAILRYFFIYWKQWAVFKGIWKAQARLFKIMEGIFLNIFIIKAFRNESFFRRKYIKELIVSLRIKAKNARFLLRTSLTSELFFQGFLGIISILGGWMIIKGHLSLGQFTAFLLYSGQLVFLCGPLCSFLSQTMQDVFSTNEFLEIMHMQSEKKETEVTYKMERIKKNLAFRNVTFAYIAGKNILEDLSFEMSPGCWHALAGSSGCGKSTIVSLLLRIYEPEAGEISIDGNLFSLLSNASWGSRIAVASQEAFICDGTVKENVVFGVNQLDAKRIEEVCRIADLHDFIASLPQGYDTLVGEGALRFSEGQKQKISIARALFRRPEILILDEAMSSLDSESEERIINGIKKIQIPLVIIVSHRLPTVMACNYVHYMKDKNTIISSTAKDLLENDRDFMALFKSQAIKDG